MQDSDSKLGSGFGVHETSNNSLLGTSTPKFIKRLTVVLAAIYFAYSILLSDITSWEGRKLYAEAIKEEQSVDNAEYTESDIDLIKV